MMENTTLYVSLDNATHSESYDTNYSVTKNDLKGHNDQSKMYESICIMAVQSVFCLLGIIGNGLVIWFGIFLMKKTVNVVWFLSLAVADFSFSFIFLLNSTQVLITYWLFVKFMCKLNNLFLYINMVASVFQITVISVDRCVCVVFPVWCQNYRKPRFAFIVVLIIWIISFALAMVSIIDLDTSNSNNRTTVCVLKMDVSSVMRMRILEFVFFFLLPFTIIVFCYIVIVLHLRRKHNVTSSKPIKTSLAVIVAFFICWFPNNLFYLLLTLEESKFDFSVIYYGSQIANSLMVMNSCVNPILYVFIGRSFKEKFCGSFQAKFENAFNEADKSERSTIIQRLSQVGKVNVSSG